MVACGGRPSGEGGVEEGGVGSLVMARRGRTIAASPGPAYHRGAVNPDASIIASVPESAARAQALEAWRAQALKELQGAPLERLTTRSAEGLRIEPLYPAEPTALPGRELLLARAGWAVCPEYRQPAAADAAAAIATDRGRGAQATWIELDERLAAGVSGPPPPPVGRHGVVLRDADEVGMLLAAIGAGRAADSGDRRGGARSRAGSRGSSSVHGLLGCDPLGAGAARRAGLVDRTCPAGHVACDRLGPGSGAGAAHGAGRRRRVSGGRGDLR